MTGRVSTIIFLAAVVAAGCSSTGDKTGVPGPGTAGSGPRTEQGYGINLLSIFVEEPMFHPYATMAIDTERFDQLDNDFGQMKQRDGNDNSSGISLRDVVVEEYLRFFPQYRELLASHAKELAERKLEKKLKSRGGGKFAAADKTVEDIIVEICDFFNLSYAANASVNQKIKISFYSRWRTRQDVLNDFALAYEKATGGGLEIEVDEYTFSVRPGPIRLFLSAKLQDKITVDNVRLYLDLKDRAIFALVTYPGDEDTSVHFVYRFPPGKVISLPESLSVFAARRKINIRRSE